MPPDFPLAFQTVPFLSTIVSPCVPKCPSRTPNCPHCVPSHRPCTTEVFLCVLKILVPQNDPTAPQSVSVLSQRVPTAAQLGPITSPHPHHTPKCPCCVPKYPLCTPAIPVLSLPCFKGRDRCPMSPHLLLVSLTCPLLSPLCPKALQSYPLPSFLCPIQSWLCPMWLTSHLTVCGDTVFGDASQKDGVPGPCCVLQSQVPSSSWGTKAM